MELLQERLSEIREQAKVQNRKQVTINLSIKELSMIISGLKAFNCFESVLEEELKIKYTHKNFKD